jgi:hypothetical protein
MATLREWLVLAGLRWSSISAVMRFRVSQAASVIPIAGYALLWSDSAQQLLQLQVGLRSGAWFSVNQRLSLVYFGSILLTVALILFWADVRGHST